MKITKAETGDDIVLTFSENDLRRLRQFLDHHFILPMSDGADKHWEIYGELLRAIDIILPAEEVNNNV